MKMKMIVMMKRPIVLLMVMALVVIPRVLLAEQLQSGWQPGNQSQAQEQAVGADAERFPNADVVDISRKTFVRYQADGSFDQYYESYAKILTEKGRRKFSSVSSSFTIPYNKTEFKVVEVIRPNGKRAVVDLVRNSRRTVDQTQMDSNIYNPNSRILSVTLPEVQIGDTVHFIIYDRFAKARVPGTFSDFVTFEGESPIVSAQYTVVAPEALPLKSIALKSEITGSVSFIKQRRNNEIIYSWTAHDVPRTFEEPDMPPLYTQVQRLLVSTVEDWQELSRWYWNLCKPAIEDDSLAMATKVKEIITGTNDPMEQIQRLFHWVSQEIRYMGITVEKEAPGYEPHPVRLTFDSRAGVCRDKATLLAAMLRLAGHDAYPVLMMNGPRKDVEVPQPYFNHAITAVRLKDGSYVLMDSTDENTKELLPAYLNDQSYLVALPQGDILRTSPVEPVENNMMKIQSHAHFEGDDLVVNTVLGFEGVNDNAYRGFFARINAHELRGFFEKIIKQSSPSAVLSTVTLEPSNMQDTSIPLTAHLLFKVMDYAVKAQDMAVLPGLEMGQSLGMLNYTLGDMGLKTRKYPILTGHTCGVDETMEIILPDELQGEATLPVSCKVNHDTHAWEKQVLLRGRRLTTTNRFSLNVTEFLPTNYAHLQNTLAAVAAAGVQKTVIKRRDKGSKDQSDAIILEDINRFEVASDSAWTEIKTLKLKVLNYAGRKRFGDVHIAFNPAWDEVTVERAAVSTPDGQVLTASQKEINLMDAPWAAMAPRYPASKIMVISLPGITEGCMIDLKVRKKKTRRPFFSINEDYMAHDRGYRTQGNRFYLLADGVLGQDVPVHDKQVQIVMPEGMALHLLEVDPGSVISSDVRTSPDGSREYRFSAKDIPAQMRESHRTPGISGHPVVHASSGDIKEFALGLNRTLVKEARPDTKIKTLALDLVKGAPETLAHIRAIRDYVSSNITPVDIGIFDMPGTSRAGETLYDGYGNSCDQAVLLFSLLKAAGLKPEFVLPSNLPGVDFLNQPFAKAPSRQLYSDLLVRVKTSEGWVYLGDTDHYAPLGTTGYDNHPGLLLKDGQVLTVKNLSPSHGNRTDICVDIDLDSQGSVQMTVERRYWGQTFAWMNKVFSELTPEKRRRYHEELIAVLRLGARPVGSYITDFDGYPGVERFTVEVDDFAARQDGVVALDLPFIIQGITGAERDERLTPLFREDAAAHDITIRLHLADDLAFTPVMPAEKRVIPVPGLGHVTMTRTIQGQEMVVKQQVELDAGVIMPETYPEMVKARQRIAAVSNRMVILNVLK